MKIGIVAHLEGTTLKSTKFGLNAAYVNYFRKYGSVILIDPTAEDIFDIDMLVLPGGADINTMRYNQAPSVHTGRPDPQYEYFDERMLPKYIELAKEGKLAIWGTCRGSQSLVATFGGSLVQHIAQAYSDPRPKLVDKVKLGEQPQEIHDEVVKAMEAKGQNWFTGVVNRKLSKGKDYSKWLDINSIHHQGYFEKNLRDTDLIILGINVIHKNVEMFMHRYLPIIGVQHHPEECNDAYSDILVRYLLNRIAVNKEENQKIKVNA